MKKFFTLIAMALMAIGANAQTISWTTDDVTSKAGLDGQTYGSDGFVLTCVDDQSKMSIEKNNAYFGTADSYEKFVADLKTGGKSQTGSKNSSLTLTIPSDGTLEVYARTGSNSDETRTVVLVQNSDTLYNAVVKEADAVTSTDSKTVYPIISVSVKEGTVNVCYPVNTIKFYGFKFTSSATAIKSTPSIEEEETPLRSPKKPSYNISGQRVSKNAKGLVIKNGKKYFNK